MNKYKYYNEQRKTDQIEVATWFAHVWQNGFLGEDVTKHTDDHREEEDEVAACSNAGKHDECQLNMTSRFTYHNG